MQKKNGVDETFSLDREESSPPSLTQPTGVLTLPAAPGLTHNPLRTLPRNEPCPCRSGRKFKLCCLAKLPQMVPKHVADSYREQMRKDDLVFLTKENEAAVMAEASAIVDEAAKKQMNACEHTWEVKTLRPPNAPVNETVQLVKRVFCATCGAIYNKEKHGPIGD